jgi:hypothetical protein
MSNLYNQKWKRVQIDTKTKQRKKYKHHSNPRASNPKPKEKSYNHLRIQSKGSTSHYIHKNYECLNIRNDP